MPNQIVLAINFARAKYYEPTTWFSFSRSYIKSPNAAITSTESNGKINRKRLHHKFTSWQKKREETGMKLSRRWWGEARRKRWKNTQSEEKNWNIELGTKKKKRRKTSKMIYNVFGCAVHSKLRSSGKEEAKPNMFMVAIFYSYLYWNAHTQKERKRCKYMSKLRRQRRRRRRRQWWCRCKRMEFSISLSPVSRAFWLKQHK